MIFVTVGHQTPFDRLIRAMDHWARDQHRDDLFAQIGAGHYVPMHMAHARFMSPEEFQQRMHAADAIVGHAGTGTIIAALQLRKPLLVMPRRAALGETRNDHQLPTARHFERSGAVLVADDEHDLPSKLAMLPTFRPAATIDAVASPRLLQRLRAFAFDPHAT